MLTLQESTNQKLHELGVRLVYLFGSYAEGMEMPHSDVDVGVVFRRVPRQDRVGETYQALYDLFTDVFPGKKLDIVFLQNAGLELRFDVIGHGKLLFEATSGEHYDFEEHTTIMYADFKPILNEMNNAILQRI